MNSEFMKIIFQGPSAADVKLHSIQPGSAGPPAFLQPRVQESISLFMAHVHTSVNRASEKYRRNEKRHNYTTPKSFLQQITLYRNLLGARRAELGRKMERVLTGLQKLQSTASQVG